MDIILKYNVIGFLEIQIEIINSPSSQAKVCKLLQLHHSHFLKHRDLLQWHSVYEILQMHHII